MGDTNERENVQTLSEQIEALILGCEDREVLVCARDMLTNLGRMAENKRSRLWLWSELAGKYDPTVGKRGGPTG